MRIFGLSGLAAALFAMSASVAGAATLVEEFNDPFPNWESGWLASNSNIRNYYGVGQDRGNQPLGLWVEDTVTDGVVDVVFNPTFGAQWTYFSIEVSTFVNPNTMTIYDVDNNTLGSFNDFYLSSYDTANFYEVTSANGIGGFRFSSSDSPGNTWIDNVTVSNDIQTPAVPVPAALPLLAGGLALLGGLRRRAMST